jgi:hypothetical protein
MEGKGKKKKIDSFLEKGALRESNSRAGQTGRANRAGPVARKNGTAQARHGPG